MAAPEGFLVSAKQARTTISSRVEKDNIPDALKEFFKTHSLSDWLNTTITLRRAEK